MRKSRTIALAAAAALLLAATPPTVAEAGGMAKPVGWGPRTSMEAAKLVVRSGREQRPNNRVPNHTIPSRSQLRKWRSDATLKMPYARYVNGRFRGTTDQIIRWAAYKWGFRPNLLRAVATIESWWQMSMVGDAGDSFGLFQVRRPWHCGGECRIARDSTAFNADYYGGILRAYFDGKMGWLNTVERGRPYKPGDLWGSVGAWYAGRWWTAPARWYVERVKDHLRQQTWRQPWF